jgi:hypothetical protein
LVYKLRSRLDIRIVAIEFYGLATFSDDSV